MVLGLGVWGYGESSRTTGASCWRSVGGIDYRVEAAVLGRELWRGTLRCESGAVLGCAV